GFAYISSPCESGRFCCFKMYDHTSLLSSLSNINPFFAGEFASRHYYTHQTSNTSTAHCRGELNSPGGRRFAHLNMDASNHITHPFTCYIHVSFFCVAGYNGFALRISFYGYYFAIIIFRANSIRPYRPPL
ncbi:MAG: hypothetical protein QM654_17725, partial [Dysgonamonadaceae bacterium]